ncbi:hypothetical protein P692DRAFT_20882473 [Suillus brevipes Sb2]|nr:hypothetical protein P692DRAFT_20882473 [Suillus brevipes Sb2]
MPKEPKAPKRYCFVNVDFDGPTHSMRQRRTDRRDELRRIVTVDEDGIGRGRRTIIYMPRPADVLPESSQQLTPFPIPPPPLPPPTQPSQPLLSRPPPLPPPAPSTPPPPSPPSPPLSLSPRMSPQSFQPSFQLPSPQPSPQPPSPPIQPPLDIESPLDSLSSIEAHLKDLKWDLEHPEMWDDYIEFSERNND